jgi:3-hydroxyisobutyrate dehydrogenase-like beta-hydroxyacid dehydrogenase
MYPVAALLPSGVEMDVLGIDYSSFSDSRSCRPCPSSFQRGYPAGFYDGIEQDQDCCRNCDIACRVVNAVPTNIRRWKSLKVAVFMQLFLPNIFGVLARELPISRQIAKCLVCRKGWTLGDVESSVFAKRRCDKLTARRLREVMQVNTLSKRTIKIGFIGLGLMGSRLTQRLHSSGWNVQAWNRSPEPGRVVSQKGIRIAPSVARLVADSDVVLSCLANDAAVHSVYCESGGVFSAAKSGTIVLEMSTISPQLSHLLHREATSQGVRLLDLAVSGSTAAVEAGTVTLLAGGDRNTFEQCTPIYESIAKQWFLVGGGSSGIQMKLVVNLLLGVEMQAIAEAVSLGEHLQLSRDVLLDVLSKTAVIPPAFIGKFQKIRNNDYSPEFPLRLMSKDMDLVMETAGSAGANLPAAGVAQSVLTSNLTSSGDLDLSAITPFVIGHGARS